MCKHSIFAYFIQWIRLLKDLVPMDTQTQFSNSKEQLRSLTNSVWKIRDASERMVQRSRQYSADMVHMGKELRYAMNCELKTVCSIY